VSLLIIYSTGFGVRSLMCSALSNLVWLSGDWQEELELWWELILSVKSIREVYSSNSAVGVNLNSVQKEMFSIHNSNQNGCQIVTERSVANTYLRVSM